jgi:hypothetical protein
MRARLPVQKDGISDVEIYGPDGVGYLFEAFSDCSQEWRRWRLFALREESGQTTRDAEIFYHRHLIGVLAIGEQRFGDTGDAPETGIHSGPGDKRVVRRSFK